MKIQLASTLPFTPVQLDARHVEPKRAVGQLHGVKDGRDYILPVYEFRHGEEDTIHYQVNPAESVFVDQLHELSAIAANDGDTSSEQTLEWMEHNDSLSYKPYAFLVMNAMTKLVGDWDGVLYRTPSGERLRESAFHATLQVVDACVCARRGLWVMVNLTGEQNAASSCTPAVRQLGWVPVAV